MTKSLSLWTMTTAFLIHSAAFAQSQKKPMIVSPIDSSKVITIDTASQVTTIITKVPFHGMNYFIKIVPIDTTIIDNMPMYNPERGRAFIIWRDSLQHLFGDSLLKYLPKRQDLLRKPKDR